MSATNFSQMYNLVSEIHCF